MTAPCPTFGFVVRAIPRAEAFESERATLVNDLTQLLGKHGLVGNGRGGGALVFLVTREGSQATDADRELVAQWANRWSAVADVQVSDLVDLNEA